MVEVCIIHGFDFICLGLLEGILLGSAAAVSDAVST